MSYNAPMSRVSRSGVPHPVEATCDCGSNVSSVGLPSTLNLYAILVIKLPIAQSFTSGPVDVSVSCAFASRFKKN